MRTITLLFSFLLVGLLARSAYAWESKGWVKLGEREVNGKVDTDTIAVGASEGKFTKLTLVVEKDELEMLGFEVTFGNGDHWHPAGETRHYFRAGTPTRVIDLPGDERVIKSITLKYKNIGKRGNARIEIWGWRAETADSGKKNEWHFAANGWTRLGERQVNGKGREDHDKLEVGKREGKFRRMAIVVENGDIELDDIIVKFGNGDEWKVGVKHYFKEGARSREIDFPGNDRYIEWMKFAYRNLNGNAKVEIYAR